MGLFTHRAPDDAPAALAHWLGTLPGGVAMAWVDAARVQYFQAGRFDPSDRRPVGPDTLFEIGSITKVFTTVLLADAVRAGRIAWDQPVGAPFARSRITYAQLATHTSGLPRLPTQMAIADDDNPYAAQDLDALVDAFARDAPAATPGPPAYSNFGVAVLGHAVAGAWGESYEELLGSRVLAPLGLSHSVLSWRDADRTLLAPGRGPHGLAGNWDLAAYAPTGGLVSSARDLALFAQACLGLVATPLRKILAATFEPRARWEGNDVLPGWHVMPVGTATLVFHDGGTGGYRSLLALDPATRQGLVLLSNHDRELDDLACKLWTGEWPAARAEVTLRDATLAEYLGDYQLGAERFSVTLQDRQLYVRLSGQPAYPVFASARDEFFYQVVDAQLTFVRGADDRVVALTLHQAGSDQRAERLG